MNLVKIKNETYRSILKFSLPAIIGMILNALISIIDGLFIGNEVGKDGLTAINLGIPILYVFLGIAIMIGVGGSTIAIQKLGAHDKKGANNLFNQTVCILFVVNIILVFIVQLIISKAIGFVSIEENIKKYMTDYYGVMLFIYPVMMTNLVLGMFVRGAGKPQVFMIVSILSNILNVGLDYLFMVKYNCGVKGAAYSSVLSIIISFLILSVFFINDKSKFRYGRFRFSKVEFRDMIFNGSSELIGQISMAITTGIYNYVIIKIMGVDGVAIMTIIGYVGYMFNMIVIGFGQGMSPIVSYCFGAKDYYLLSKIRKCTQTLVFLCSIVIVMSVYVSASSYAELFSNKQEIKVLVKQGLRIYATGFAILGFNTISSFFFTAISKAKESAIISMLRGLIILIMCIFILPKLFGVKGVFAVMPVTELITFFVSIYLIKTLAKKGYETFSLNMKVVEGILEVK